MACCGQAPSGYVKVWQLRVDGQVVATSGDQGDVEKAKVEKHGGRGVVLSVLEPVTRRS